MNACWFQILKYFNKWKIGYKMEKIPDVKNKLNETNAFFLLEKIIPKDESLYLWCYSSSKELVATTCPQAYKLESLFSLFEMKLSLKEY